LLIISSFIFQIKEENWLDDSCDPQQYFEMFQMEMEEGTTLKKRGRPKKTGKDISIGSHLVCHLCSSVCRDLNESVIHMKENHCDDSKDSQFICVLCSKSLFTKSQLKTHLKNHQRNFVTNPSKGNNSQKVFFSQIVSCLQLSSLIG